MKNLLLLLLVFLALIGCSNENNTLVTSQESVKLIFQQGGFTENKGYFRGLVQEGKLKDQARYVEIAGHSWEKILDSEGNEIELSDLKDGDLIEIKYSDYEISSYIQSEDGQDQAIASLNGVTTISLIE